MQIQMALLCVQKHFFYFFGVFSATAFISVSVLPQQVSLCLSFLSSFFPLDKIFEQRVPPFDHNYRARAVAGASLLELEFKPMHRRSKFYQGVPLSLSPLSQPNAANARTHTHTLTHTADWRQELQEWERKRKRGHERESEREREREREIGRVFCPSIWN